MRGYTTRINQGRLQISNRAIYHITRQTARFSSTNPPAFYRGLGGGQHFFKAIGPFWRNVLSASDRASWSTYAANNPWVDDNLQPMTLKAYEMYILFITLMAFGGLGSTPTADASFLPPIGSPLTINSFHWVTNGKCVFNIHATPPGDLFGIYASLRMTRRPLFSPSNGGWIATNTQALFLPDHTVTRTTTHWNSINIPIGSQPLTQIQQINTTTQGFYKPQRIIPGPTTAS